MCICHLHPCYTGSDASYLQAVISIRIVFYQSNGRTSTSICNPTCPPCSIQPSDQILYQEAPLQYVSVIYGFVQLLKSTSAFVSKVSLKSVCTEISPCINPQTPPFSFITVFALSVILENLYLQS